MLAVLPRLLFNAFRLVTAPFFWFSQAAGRPQARWVHLRLRPRLVEIERPFPALLRYVPGLSEVRPTSLTLLRKLVGFVLADERVEGVVVDLPPLEAGWSLCQGLRDQLVRLRAGGKKVVVYLHQGGGNRELFVASAADRMLATPNAQLSPLGLAASVTYFKGALDRAGLEVEVLRRAEYKTAAEPATNESMSAAQREQLGALLDTIDGRLRAALQEREGFDKDRVDRLFEEAVFTGQRAKEVGLLDDVCYEDELPTCLTGDGTLTPVVRGPRYFAWKTAELLSPILPQRFVAVITLHGPIGQGTPGTRAGLQFMNMVATLRAARRSPQVAGVVLHVDSPGGSALVSDLLHREVLRLKERKPVVAAFGDVAASGGYYVAAAADAVVAQPLTITGSIGVVAAKLVTEPLLTRFGVNIDTVRRAPHADMFGRPGRWPEEEHKILDRELEEVYRAFVGVVAEGRGRPTDEIEPLARGRVWSGADAQEKGLVDRLGGLDAAVEEVKRRLEEKGQALPESAEARFFRVRRLEIMPAEPPLKEAARAVLGRVDTRLSDLLELSGSPDRVFCYALDVPDVR